MYINIWIAVKIKILLLKIMKIYVQIAELYLIINISMKYLLKITILCQIYYFIKNLFIRGKNIYIICVCILKKINDSIILFFDNSLEDIENYII